METKTVITIEATVRADAGTVWACWTQPEHIVNWNFASDEWCCPSATVDLQVGGTYSSRMESKDGSMGFDFTAKYTAVDAPKRLAFVMEDERTVSVEFIDNKDGTVHVIERFEAESMNPVEMQRDGWQAILNNFKQYAETV